MALSEAAWAGNVTIFGALGTVAFTGVASADMMEMALTDNVTLVEQKGGHGCVNGAVAVDQRDDLVLRFYPVPAQTEAGFKGVELPVPLTTVTVSRVAPYVGDTNSPLNSSIRLVGAVNKVYRYIGGGTITQTAEGLAVMNLPLRKWTKFS